MNGFKKKARDDLTEVESLWSRLIAHIACEDYRKFNMNMSKRYLHMVNLNIIIRFLVFISKQDKQYRDLCMC